MANTSRGLNHVILDGLAFVEKGGGTMKVALGSSYHDPLQAINGLLTDMRSFLEADISQVRAKGIRLAPEPLNLVDPHR